MPKPVSLASPLEFSSFVQFWTKAILRSEGGSALAPHFNICLVLLLECPPALFFKPVLIPCMVIDNIIYVKTGLGLLKDCAVVTVIDTVTDRCICGSDIIVQIVDARNPLLFRCEDLERYVKEIQKDKDNMILLNKSDLLTCEQRRAWARYFDKEGVQVVFWSATAEGKRLDAEGKGEEQETEGSEMSERECSRGSGTRFDARDGLWPTYDADEDDSSEYEDCEDDDSWQTCSGDDKKNITHSDIENMTGHINISPASTGHCENCYKENDGPSSSSSSDKTEFIKKSISLLQFFSDTQHKPEEQALIFHFRHILEATYGINIIHPREDEDSNRQPTSEELLTAYG
eukprot:g48051.t1